MWMSHGTHVNESWHTCEWVMAHMWMSRGTHVTEPRSPYQLSRSTLQIVNVRGAGFLNKNFGHLPLFFDTLSHDTHADESQHTCRRVDKSHVTQNTPLTSCPGELKDMVRCAGVLNMNESCHKREEVTAHMWKRHVITHVNESQSPYQLSRSTLKVVVRGAGILHKNLRHCPLVLDTLELFIWVMLHFVLGVNLPFVNETRLVHTWNTPSSCVYSWDLHLSNVALCFWYRSAVRGQSEWDMTRSYTKHVFFMCVTWRIHRWVLVLLCVAVRCSVLYCSVLQRGAVWCSVVQSGAVWCSVVQCGAVLCSVLQSCNWYIREWVM